jgi:hypothetical protein
MDIFCSGDIVPGERVGQFCLGASWIELEPQLPRAYVLQQRSGCFVAQLPCIWFFIEESEQQVSQITVLNQFEGTIAGSIGLGSTGAQVAANLGAWIEDEYDNLIIPAQPGVCFEVGFVSGQDLDWQLHNAPIATISVYQAKPER